MERCLELEYPLVKIDAWDEAERRIPQEIDQWFRVTNQRSEVDDWVEELGSA